MARYGFAFTFNYKDEGGSEQDCIDKFNELKGALGHCGITYIVFALERGDKEDRLHVQGYLQSNQKMKNRFHKKFNIFVKPQERSAVAAAEYCKKTDGFFEAGDFDGGVKGTMEKKQGARSDLDAVKEAIDRGESYEEICDAHFGEAAKYSRFISEQIMRRDNAAELSSSLKEYEGVSWKPWQDAVIQMVQEEPNPRRIHWIWEEIGHVGKSWLARYLAAKFGAIILKPAKGADLAHIISKSRSKIVIFDLSRTAMPEEGSHFLDSAYNLAEDLKNGVIQSTKYDSTMMIRGTSHVIFFANFPPDMTKWSQDRYFIKKL